MVLVNNVCIVNNLRIEVFLLFSVVSDQKRNKCCQNINNKKIILY